MSSPLVLLAISVLSGSLCAQVSPTTPEAPQVRIIERPKIELAKEYLTIISCTTNNPVARPYPSRSRALWQGPESPDRDCQISDQVKPGSLINGFSRSLDNLKPQTTYYYTIDSMQATGKRDGVESTVSRLEDGFIFRCVTHAGTVWGSGISEKVVWWVVGQYTKIAAIEKLSPHDLRRTCARLCHSTGGELEQIQFLLGSSICRNHRTIPRSSQRLVHSVNDKLGIEPDISLG